MIKIAGYLGHVSKIFISGLLIIKNIRANELDTDTKNLLTLFGISQEELVEAGATYEELSILKRHM